MDLIDRAASLFYHRPQKRKLKQPGLDQSPPIVTKGTNNTPVVRREYTPADPDLRDLCFVIAAESLASVSSRALAQEYPGPSG